MSDPFKTLAQSPRLLFSIPLRPVQGSRFQPTGFPSLGAATFQTASGVGLLVESAQSIANRLETSVWDEGKQEPVPALQGVSHVTVSRNGKFFTDSMLESHRLNSPYLIEGKDDSFKKKLISELGELGQGPIDRRLLASVLFKYDVGSLIHGVFLAKKDLAGGRLRVARALSGFIEADGVRVAASGGVKNDHVNPSGDTKKGYGNVPFSRDEFTAERITLFVNLDLALLRGYGLTDQQVELLIAISLYKVDRLLEVGLRLRTACDLERAEAGPVRATRPDGWTLPSTTELTKKLETLIKAEGSAMLHTRHAYEDTLKQGADESEGDESGSDDQDGQD
jgi:CRISPR-associated protein Csb1